MDKITLAAFESADDEKQHPVIRKEPTFVVDKTWQDIGMSITIDLQGDHADDISEMMIGAYRLRHICNWFRGAPITVNLVGATDLSAIKLGAYIQNWNLNATVDRKELTVGVRR